MDGPESGELHLWLPQQYRLTVEDEPEAAALEVLSHSLEDFNQSRWPGHLAWRPLGIFIRDTGAIVAGLSGETYCGWLVIKYLWVRDDLRRRGIGRELMAQAEAHAVERGCHSAWLDTFSFQARQSVAWPHGHYSHRIREHKSNARTLVRHRPPRVTTAPM